MKEIRFHARGGQGAVTSSQVLATAAFLDGKYCQAFPMFGVERRGAPIEAYARIRRHKPLNLRSWVYNPNYVIVLDQSLLASVDVTKGIRRAGKLIVNTVKSKEELRKDGLDGEFTVYPIDVTGIAMEHIGKPFVNVAVLGAFAAIVGKVTLRSLKKAVDLRFGKEKKRTAKKNKDAVAAVYKHCKKEFKVK